MKDFPGTPGTYTGLFLRVAQLLLAAASIVTMSTTRGFSGFTAFCFLIASMCVQVAWSLAIASLDAYSLACKKVVRIPLLVNLFAAGDWVTATFSFGAACASAGILVLYDKDFGYCKAIGCLKFQISVFLAFLSWMLTEISFVIMFTIRAAV